VSDKYVFIDAGYATVAADTAAAPTVTRMCHWLRVSKSGFYEWRSRPESETARRRELLKVKMAALFKANDGTYGYRRMHAALARGGERCGPELVRALMRELGLVALPAAAVAAVHDPPGRGRPDPGPGAPRLHRAGPRGENGRVG
jgi:hypothetical protein